MAVFVPALTVGRAFTVTITDFVSLQPLASVSVAVYVIVVVGDTVIDVPVPKDVVPSNHSIDPFPEAVIDVVDPAQIVAPVFTVINSCGVLFTVTFMV